MTIQELIDLHNHPEMAEQAGMVYQVYEDGEITLQKSGDLLGQRNLEDGEITLQKSGDLLGQRNLHRMSWPHEQYKKGYKWPSTVSGFGYIYTDREGAEAVRDSLYV